MQFLFSHHENNLDASQAGLSAAPGSQSAFYAPVLDLSPEIYRSHDLSAALEIHDLITQKLFSASLIADVLPRLWELNPSEGRNRLGELREITQEAMLEMHSLLAELRDTESRLKIELEGRNAKRGAGSE